MKNNLLKKIISVPAALFILASPLLFLSCGVSTLSAPAGLEAADADPDNPNRIVLSWLPAEGADIYYVYRSLTEGGIYSYAGFSQTSGDIENSDGDTELRYSYIQSFDAGEGGTYWYAVSAASNADISASESPLSRAVEASTYSGTWSTAKDLGTAAQLKLAADGSTLYAVYSAGSPVSSISVQTYAEDESSTADDPPMIWSALGTGPGTTDVDVDGPFSVFISSGELYTVFRDDSSSDYVSMKYYHNSGDADNPAFAWEQVGAAGFSDAAAAGISAAAVGFSGDIYTGFRIDFGNDEAVETPPLNDGQLYKYDSTTEAWFPYDISTYLPTDLTTIELVSHNNNIYYGYEDLDQSQLYIRAYNEGALQAGGLVTDSPIDDGNAVFISGGGDLYAVYITDPDNIADNGDGNIFVSKQVDGEWTTIPTAGELASNDTCAYGTLDAHWFNGYLYIFYISSDDDKGWVKYYDEDEGWLNAQRNGGVEVTGTGAVTKVQLASSGSVLYAGWVEDENAYVRVLE